MTYALNAFDERFFELYVNPLLHSLRQTVTSMIPAGSSVIDVGCGTGEQCAMLASICRRIVGIDPDEKNISETRDRMKGMDRPVDLIQSDFSALGRFEDAEFDVAVMVMRIHELDMDQRVPVLRDVFRIARRVILCDYLIPQPMTAHGDLARTSEMLGGDRHFTNFRLYQHAGGLKFIERTMKIKPVQAMLNPAGTIEVKVYSPEVPPR
ncbi:MAG TPA: class I SAM-dependent methyltransferase [bacterium]|nr:class I SAM-dependent methyltransferase [bacterium]